MECSTSHAKEDSKLQSPSQPCASPPSSISKLTLQLAHPNRESVAARQQSVAVGLTWISCLAIGASLVSRNGLDQLLQHSFIPCLIALAHCRCPCRCRHGGRSQVKVVPSKTANQQLQMRYGPMMQQTLPQYGRTVDRPSKSCALNFSTEGKQRRECSPKR